MCMGEGLHILIRFWRALSVRVSSEVSSDVSVGEGSQMWIRFGGGPSGRVSREVPSNVFMDEGSQILIRFGGCRRQGVVGGVV